MMNESNRFSGFRCDDAIGQEGITIVSLPMVPDPSEGKGRHIRQVNVVRDFICAGHLPFIVTVGRN